LQAFWANQQEENHSLEILTRILLQPTSPGVYTQCMSEQHQENSSKEEHSCNHCSCHGRRSIQKLKIGVAVSLVISIIALAVSLCGGHEGREHHGWHEGPPMMQGGFDRPGGGFDHSGGQMVPRGTDGGQQVAPGQAPEATPAPRENSSR